jgi:hypothetical protein
MADFNVIAAVGRTLERLLDAAFDGAEQVEGANTRAVPVRSDDFDLSTANNPIVFRALSIVLYRVKVAHGWAAGTRGIFTEAVQR